MKRNENGFTLIELLIVIVIIGILAAVAIPRFKGVADKAKISNAQEEAATIKLGMVMYYAENSAFPPAATITNHATLVSTLTGFVEVPPAATARFTYGAYTRSDPDTFQLTITALDGSTTLTINQDTIITP